VEDFIRYLENALWHFGGCPKVLVIDNLCAPVHHPDWFDPELVLQLRSLSQRYGVVPRCWIPPQKSRLRPEPSRARLSILTRGRDRRGVEYAKLV